MSNSEVWELKKRFAKVLLGLVGVFCMLVLAGSKVRAAETFTAQDLYNRYPDIIELSPDRKAWTIPGVPGSVQSLPKGYRITTGIESTIRALEEGEHYYKVERSTAIPVGYWEVKLPHSICSHFWDEWADFHGVVSGPICGGRYDNGWYAYCADCGDEIADMLIYAHSDDIRRITVLPGVADHYYLCPLSGSMEQGTGYIHLCDKISFNRYRVQYLKNMPEDAIVYGIMGETYHMYNNESVFEGVPATYTDTALRKNSYTCTGYKFIGWNTEADGSGTWFTDGQQVLNLTTENNDYFYLFAQWQPIETTLFIDANGGTYAGEEVFNITKKYREQYLLLETAVSTPEGYDITFEENGGSECEDITTVKQFSQWQPVGAFGGKLKDNWYSFLAETDGHVDTIKVMYKDVPVTLPTAEKENISFAGWYYDADLKDYCGQAGDEVSFTEDVTLYAKWVPLVLYSEDNYEANNGWGAVNLRWEQKDNLDKVYRIYQFADTDFFKKLTDVPLGNVNSVLSAEDWVQIADADSTAEAVAVNNTYSYKAGGETFKVEYTGYYQITATGGSGGDFDEDHKGGKGGKVGATFWLKKGDIITSYAGTAADGERGGVNGNSCDGGTAEGYMGGGAGSEVYITRDGVTTLLLAAGGGGGATDAFAGGDGGLEDALRVDGESKGEDGIAGGGGGYTGGIAGSSGAPTFTFDFDYDNCIYGKNEFIAPFDGVYKLEVWGSAGTGRNEEDDDGDYADYVIPGKGGYATGTIELKKGDKLYVRVGTPSYNGGTGVYYARGGGATHIATVDRGELKNYESYKEEVLVVAGGGGGAYNYGGANAQAGDGGGETGGTGSSRAGGGSGGSQTVGGTVTVSSWNTGSFGQGGNSNYAGGGGGWYGGAGNNGAGGGGSSYIKSTLTDRYTESGVNTGHGKARITLNPQEK